MQVHSTNQMFDTAGGLKEPRIFQPHDLSISHGGDSTRSPPWHTCSPRASGRPEAWQPPHPLWMWLSHDTRLRCHHACAKTPQREAMGSIGGDGQSQIHGPVRKGPTRGAFLPIRKWACCKRARQKKYKHKWTQNFKTWLVFIERYWLRNARISRARWETHMHVRHRFCKGQVATSNQNCCQNMW